MVDNSENPLFDERSGGGVIMGTVFTQLESGEWEREINLTNGDGVCASSLLSASYELRIVLVEETATRTVFADFTPAP